MLSLLLFPSLPLPKMVWRAISVLIQLNKLNVLSKCWSVNNPILPPCGISLERITIWNIYGKYFAKLTSASPCVTFVATGREREEDSRGLRQNLEMTCVTFDMSSGHSSAAPPGTVVPGCTSCPAVHGLVGSVWLCWVAILFPRDLCSASDTISPHAAPVMAGVSQGSTSLQRRVTPLQCLINNLLFLPLSLDTHLNRTRRGLLPFDVLSKQWRFGSPQEIMHSCDLVQQWQRMMFSMCHCRAESKFQRNCKWISGHNTMSFILWSYQNITWGRIFLTTAFPVRTWSNKSV